MPLIAERVLRQGMREGSFAPVYCFFGQDDYQKESMLREFLAVAVDPATRDFNCDVLRGGDAADDALDTALNTPPLLSARRVIVVRDVHALSRAARDVLDRYLRHPALDSVLLLILPAGEQPDASLVADSSAIEFRPLAEERIPRWIVQHAQTSLGVEITPAAVALLHNGLGGDLAVLASELDKLASYSDGATITEATVAAVVGVRDGETIGELLDAVAFRDSPKAAALASRVLTQPKTNLVTTLMALATQFLAIGWGVALRERNGRAPSLEREYFALLRETRVYPGRSWSEAVACWSRAAPRWKAAEIDTALALLLAADHAAKETRFSSDEQVLAALVLALCATAQRAVA